MNQNDDTLALSKQEIDKLTDIEISDKDLKALEEVRKELDLLNVDELLKDLPKLEDIEFPNLDDLNFDLHMESEDIEFPNLDDLEFDLHIESE